MISLRRHVVVSNNQHSVEDAMTFRLAAALLILLPAGAGCLASPVGVLVGPFAGQVLAQQRQEARDKAADRKPGPAAEATCQPGRGDKRAAQGAAAKAHCDATADELVAVRNRADLDPLPDPDRKRTAD
jgi:hypothetical protein